MDARPTGQEAQEALSRPRFDPPWGRIAVPEVKKKDPRLSRVIQSTGLWHHPTYKVTCTCVQMGYEIRRFSRTCDKFSTLMRNAPGHMIFPVVRVFFLEKRTSNGLGVLSCYHSTTS